MVVSQVSWTDQLAFLRPRCNKKMCASWTLSTTHEDIKYWNGHGISNWKEICL